MIHVLVFFVQLLTISLPCITGQGSQLVYDTEGHELSTDSPYYILPAEHGTGGGFENYEYEECLFFVGQAQSEGHNGLPVRIKSASNGAVGLSSNFTIVFDIGTTCEESLDWYVSDDSPMSSLEQHQYIGTGGTLLIGRSMPPSIFRIDRYEGKTERYKLVWCPDEGPCNDLGVEASSKGTNWLVTSNSPLAVVFKKAHGD